MIRLHQFPRSFGLPNPSPFCMKVETYLRLADIPYEIVDLHDPRKGPKGKGPFITDGGRTIADSHFILDHLKATYGDPLGQGLDARDRARHIALVRMCEEHLYFAAVRLRWLVPENAAIIRSTFFTGMPAPLRPLVFRLARAKIHRDLMGQGMGRHTVAEVERLGSEDVEVLSVTLGEAPFFGGDAPREVDCTTWGFIANLLVPPFRMRMKDEAAARPNLVAYHHRMMARMFPELG
ncbi:MAG: glutathione S-transferase family protein [Rhodospirillales bacterium]|nr:MAG: glutathione S-transferase family protein [Rhodospirillales bacterium]